MATKFRVALLLAALGLVAVGAFFWVATGDARADPEGHLLQYQSANMFVFGKPNDLLPGAATLTRSPKGISYSVHTSGLTPGHAYTVWVVVFNRPENCVDGCNAPDVSVPAVRAAVGYGASYIAGQNGNSNFHGSLNRGSPPAGRQVNEGVVPAGTTNRLEDPMRAEIHLVVRTHGMPIAGQAAQQLTTFELGCAVCANVQAAMFLPPKRGGDDE
jgi:hypothetical protein